jgi:hypothetical protein
MSLLFNKPASGKNLAKAFMSKPAHNNASPQLVTSFHLIGNFFILSTKGLAYFGLVQVTTFLNEFIASDDKKI